MAKKRKQKKLKRGSGKVTVKATSSEKKAAAKRKATRKPAVRRRPVRERQAVTDTQSVATVLLKRPARSAASGAGGGGVGGVSVIEGTDSESAIELLEEGQTFEAGIVSGVENATDADQGEVRTHETYRKSTTTKTGRKILVCDRGSQAAVFLLKRLATPKLRLSGCQADVSESE